MILTRRARAVTGTRCSIRAPRIWATSRCSGRGTALRDVAGRAVLRVRRAVGRMAVRGGRAGLRRARDRAPSACASAGRSSCWPSRSVRTSSSTCCSRRRSRAAMRCRWSCRWRTSPSSGLRCAAVGCRLAVAVAIAMFGAHVGGTSIAAYSRGAGAGVPAARRHAARRGGDRRARPCWRMDRRESFDLRRPIKWMGGAMPAAARTLPAPPQHEWLEAVKYWNGGGRAPVWFVVDPLRTEHRPGAARRSRALPVAAAVSGAPERRAAERDGLVPRRSARVVRRRRLGADAGSGRRRRRGPSRARRVRRSTAGSVAARSAASDDRRPDLRPVRAAASDGRARRTACVRDRDARARRLPPVRADSGRLRDAGGPVGVCAGDGRSDARARASRSSSSTPRPPGHSSALATAGTSRSSIRAPARWRWLSERGELHVRLPFKSFRPIDGSTRRPRCTSKASRRGPISPAARADDSRRPIASSSTRCCRRLLARRATPGAAGFGADRARDRSGVFTRRPEAGGGRPTGGTWACGSSRRKSRITGGPASEPDTAASCRTARRNRAARAPRAA